MLPQSVRSEGHSEGHGNETMDVRSRHDMCQNPITDWCDGGQPSVPCRDFVTPRIGHNCHAIKLIS